MISRPGNVVGNSSAREDLVTFDPVEPLCPAKSDVTLRYTLGTRVAANPLDWVGIFKSGCRDTDNPLTCQWAPVAQSDGVTARERHLVFPAKFIQPLTDQPESCQFLYVSGSGHILGASQPFKVTDTGDMVGAQTSCPVAESRDGHSANQDANSYVNISPEFLSSDEEWELASREELCKTNSTTSDLSDIEILSTSPSKEAVKMQVSATCDDGTDDVCLLEKCKPGSLLVDHAAPQCFDHQRVAVVPKVQSTLQYSRIVGVCEPEQEIVEVKRKLKKRVKRCQEEDENGLAKCINVKESTKVKKLKQSNIALRKIDKQTNKSRKILNAPASVIRNVQVNSESSSDNEEYSSGVQNCKVRKRKRKSNTEKNKCHLTEQHNIAVSSDSYPEIQQANIKKAKRKRIRPKMEESVTPLCNRLALGQLDVSDCKTCEVVDNLNKIIEIDQQACRTKPEMESVNSKRTGQRIEMDCERLNYFDENNLQEAFSLNLEDVASPAKTKVSSKKKKKVDDNLKEKDTSCFLKNGISPDKMSCRKEMDAKTKFEMISFSHNNTKSPNNTMINPKLVRNSDENKTHQVIPLGMEDLISENRIIAPLRNVEEMRNVSVVPLCNKRTKYPEKLTANSKLASDDGLRINNSFKMQNVFFGEEICFKKFNNNDESERHNTAKLNLHTIEDSKKQCPTSHSDDDHGRKREEVSVCKLQDVELTEKIQTNSKLTRVSGIDCFQGDTITELKGVPPRKKLKANRKTSNNSDKKLQVTTVLKEQRMTENTDTTKHKPVSQIRNSQLGEIDVRMFKTSNVGFQHHCDGEIGENRPELSGGFMWDISLKETTEPVISDCCPEKVRKKCPRKMKLRTRKEASIKRQADVFGEEMAAVISDRNQTEETHQNSIQSFAVAEDTYRPSLNHTVPPESSSQNREMIARALKLDGNSTMCVEYGASCREKPTCGVTDEGSCLIDWGDLRSGGSRADRTGPCGHQVRKEKSSTSKVRGLQSKFKAKYKFQGRTSSRMQYFRRGEINKWRKLCRLLILNKRRFKATPGIAASDVDGKLVESQNTEGSTKCILLEVSTRPRVPDITKSVISGSATVGSVDAKCRQTYASVVKGTKQDLSISDEKEQINCIVGNAYNEWFATTHHSTECPKKDTGLAELEEKSKHLFYNCLSNTEVSSLQNTYKLPGLELENNPNILNAGKEFSWDFPARKSGNLSVSRNFVTRAGSEVETVCSCSNTSGHTSIVSDDISGVKMAEDTSVKMAEEISVKMAEETSVKMAEETSLKMAEETKETQCAEGKLAGVLRDAEDIPIIAPDDLQADIRTERDDVILDWPLPASFTRVSLLKGNSKCGHVIPLQTKRTADNQGILASCMKAGVIPSTWISDQPLTDHTCPDTPFDVSMSSEIELPSSQAGQTEVAETVVSKEAAGRGQPHQRSGDSKTDDIQLVWPLPGFNTLSSKFGFEHTPGDQANVQQINNHKLFQRDDSHSWSVHRISLDVPSFPGPIQSQLSIPRIRGPPNNSYIKTAPSPCPKNHKNGLDQTEARLNEENTDLRQRVNALEKQLEDLNYILANQQQTHVHSGGNGDDVVVSGSSRSGKFKSVKHKRVPVAKSKGCAMASLARSSVETVSVKPKVRIHKTRLADLENQMNIFRETLMNATRQPVKIHVKCKKLRVKISGQKCGTKTGQATESPITLAVTEEEDDAHESHSGMDNEDLVQETLPTVDDLHEEESRSEITNGVRRATPLRVEDSHCHHQSPLGEIKWVVDKSASEEADPPVIFSPVPVYDEFANREYQGLHKASTTRTRKLIPEALPHTEDHLYLIPQRVDDRHLTRRAFSSVRNSYLVSDHDEQTFSVERRPDLILETPSKLDNFDHARQTLSELDDFDHARQTLSELDNFDHARQTLSNLRSHDSVPEMPSRVGVSCEVRRTCSRPWEYGHVRENHSSVEECHLADSRSRSTGETKARKETAEKPAALPSTPGDQLRECDHHGIVRSQLNENGHQVSLVGMGDAPSLISTSQDSLGFPHTNPKHDCSGGSFALRSGNAYAPTCKVSSTYANRCSAHPVVTSHKLRNLKMYTSLSDDNHYCTESLWNDHHRDGEYVSIPPPYSHSHSPCSYLTSLEKHSEYLNSPEMCPSEIPPMNSSLDRRIRQVCQHSHTSFTPELPYMSTSKTGEYKTQTPHPQQWIGTHHCHHKLRSQNDYPGLNEDSPRKESYLWTSNTKMSFPKQCCWHLAHSVGNCLRDDKQLSEKNADNPTSSNTHYLTEKHQCLYHTSENKHTQHVKDSQPHFSPMHLKSQGKYEQIFSGRTARLSSRDTDTGSADVDGDSRPSFLMCSPKSTVDIATHNEDFNEINFPKDKPKCPSSSKHSEPRTFCMPYYNSESQSSDPVDCSNRQRVHERHQFRSKKHNHSEKQIEKTLDHEVNLPHLHCHNLLHHKLRQVSSLGDTNSACPYQAWNDPHAEQYNSCRFSQMPCGNQHSSLQPQQHCSHPNSLLYPQYPPYLHNDAYGHVWDNTCMNNTCLSPTSLTENCEERLLHYSRHMHQADEKADQLNPTAVTEYLPSHNSCRNCFCFTDDCTHRRQIEGCQSCLQHITS